MSRLETVDFTVRDAITWCGACGWEFTGRPERCAQCGALLHAEKGGWCSEVVGVDRENGVITVAGWADK